MTEPTFVLLPSPFLGPAMWQPVADVLRQRGRDVVVARSDGAAPATAFDVLEQLLRAVPTATDVVLVPHSNAGLYVPAVAAERRVVAAVFVDAALPPLAGGSAPTAPPELRAALAAKVDEAGVLPVWTDWWDDADVAPLFQDSGRRREVESEQRRLPLSYVEALVPVPAWDLPCAYLAFGDTYAPEIEAAGQAGWPVRIMDGHHLHMLSDPAGVADAILDVAP